MRAFHENPNCIHTELTLKRSLTKCMFSVRSTKIFQASETNSLDPDKTAPEGAV